MRGSVDFTMSPVRKITALSIPNATSDKRKALLPDAASQVFDRGAPSGY